jgi:hypothetical protein
MPENTGPRGPLEEILDTIRARFGCDARFLAAEWVGESLRGGHAWRGTVLLFELVDPAPASVCYALLAEGRTAGDAVLVLGSERVYSAESAVREHTRLQA